MVTHYIKMTPVDSELTESELNKVKNKLISQLKKTLKCRIRANFLAKCIQHKVTPATLSVVAPKNEACQTPELAKQYQNAANSASQSYVKIAFSDVSYSKL